jgi:hypothetical protein
MRSRYRRVRWSSHYFTKFADCLCRYRNFRIDLDPHLIRQATERDLQPCGTFGFVMHAGLLPAPTTPRHYGSATGLRVKTVADGAGA